MLLIQVHIAVVMAAGITCGTLMEMVWCLKTIHFQS